MSSLSKNKDELTLEDILTSVRTYIEDEEQIAVIEQAYKGIEIANIIQPNIPNILLLQ